MNYGRRRNSGLDWGDNIRDARDRCRDFQVPTKPIGYRYSFGQDEIIRHAGNEKKRVQTRSQRIVLMAFGE